MLPLPIGYRPTVLIADDEVKVGQLIRTLVDWDGLGIDLLAIVDSGVSAYEMVLSKKPDIVITDIRMPGMDGLELIEKSREAGLDTRFVVISGYRHFEYARRALKFGVDDYLLKPINREELNSILKKILSDLAIDREKERNDSDTRLELRMSRGTLVAELLGRLRARAPSIAGLTQANAEYGLCLKDGLFLATSIRLDRKRGTECDRVQDRLVLARISELIDTCMVGDAVERISAPRGGLLVDCVFNFRESSRRTIRDALAGLFSSIQEHVEAFGSYVPTMGVGEIVDDFGALGLSLQGADIALSYRIKLGVGRKICVGDYHFAGADDVERRIAEHAQAIAKAVDSFNPDAMAAVIRLIFQEIAGSTDADPGLYYGVADELTSTVANRLKPFSNDSLAAAFKELARTIPEASDAASLERLLVVGLESALQNCRETQAARINKPIRDAKRYISEHYAEKILLEDIADIVNMNPVYLSAIFKSESGQNFSDYLASVRVEAAQALLRDGYETVASIAEKVGYKDVRYFSQLFTKLVGVNPAKYRKLYS
jgi:two-component system response regulator YesN